MTSHILGFNAPLLDAQECRAVVEEVGETNLGWSASPVHQQPVRTIVALIERQCERNPEKVAVVFEGEQLTYDELNRRANRVSVYLGERGVGPETLVGLCVDRSLTMIVALLGILKAGGAYVPLDPDFPAE